MRKVVNVTWQSSEAVGQVEGHVLATYLRIKGTGKTYLDRSVLDSPATMLTEELVEAIAAPYAFTMGMAREHGLKTKRELDTFMKSVRPNRAIVWLNVHQREAAEAKKRLLGLVGRFSATG